MAHYEVLAPLNMTRDVQLEPELDNQVNRTNQRERVRQRSNFFDHDYSYPFQNKTDRQFFEFYKFVKSMGFDIHSFQLLVPFHWNTSDGYMSLKDISGSVAQIQSTDQPLINVTTNTNEGNGTERVFKCAVAYSVAGGPSFVERLQNTLDATTSPWSMAAPILVHDGDATTTAFTVQHGVATVTFDTAPLAGKFPRWGGVFPDVVKFDGFEASAREGAIYSVIARLRRTLI